MTILKRSPRTLFGSAVETGTLAFIISFLFAIISIDANREQEAFNRGAIELTLGAGAAHIAMCGLVFWRRKPGRGDRFFISFGGGLMIFAALAAYFASASIMLGRVL